MLITQTTHETSARAGYFLGIERKILLFRHFYRHLAEIIKKFGATERKPADTKSADHLCFVSYPYLTEFYSRSERGGKILYKLSEVNSAVGSEIKKEFGIIKCIFRLNELHFKSVLGDFAETY